MMSSCQNCHSNFEGKYCPTCGLPKELILGKFGRLTYLNESIGNKYKKCYECYGANPLEANYCRICGSRINDHAIDSNGYEYVDLGLSVLWSTMNCRETRIRLHEDFTIETLHRPTKLSRFNKVEYMGKGWRIPTMEDFEELIEKCKWEKICTPDNTIAFKVSGNNDNYIIIPVTTFTPHRLAPGEEDKRFYFCYLTSSIVEQVNGIEVHWCLYYLNDIKCEVKKKQTKGQSKEWLLNFLKKEGITDPWNIRGLSKEERQKEWAETQERIRQLEKDTCHFDQSEYELREYYEKEYIKEVNGFWLKYPVEKNNLIFRQNFTNFTPAFRTVKEK